MHTAFIDNSPGSVYSQKKVEVKNASFFSIDNNIQFKAKVLV